MIFESEDYLMEPSGIPVPEENHPYLIRDIIEYIDKVKKLEKDTPIIDIIMDYTFKNDLDIYAVGDVIASDVYFKSFIEKDCEFHRIFKTDINQIEEW